MLTQDRLKELLHYDENTGMFVWIAKTSPHSSSIRIGEVAGTINAYGYRDIKILGKTYKAHRLAWLYVHGTWPSDFIDHFDEDKSNNRIENLRNVSRNVNEQNQTNPQGVNPLLGVSWHKHTQKWVAQIKTEGKVKHLGLFLTPEEGHEAYLKAKRALHPESKLAQCG